MLKQTRRWLLKLWGDSGRTVVGLSVLAVIPVFVVASEGQLKELAERFLGGCLFVIEKAATKEGHVVVVGHLAGKPPERFPLTFEGRNGVLINSLEFEAAYRDGTDSEPVNLAFHPLTGSICPGRLCEFSTPNRPVITVVLSDLLPDFEYRFRVRLLDEKQRTATENLENLRVYAILDAGLSGGACRLQSPQWFNSWVWMSTTAKALLFIFVVVTGGLILRWAKEK